MLISVQTEFASQITYSSVTCIVKISLLMLYRRIFSLRAKWFQIAWWTNVGLVGVLFIVFIALTCTQCKDLSTIWDSSGSCIPDQTMIATSGFINAVIDSAILVLPLRMVWLLQMDRKQKVAICGVFGLGLMCVLLVSAAERYLLTTLQRRCHQPRACYCVSQPRIPQR